MARELIVFSGRSNPEFSRSVAEGLGIELGRLEIVKFSDGELSVDVGDNVRGKDVFVIQSTSSPGNDHLMELLIVIDALKRASASRITAVIPYFGYARQDRKLKPRVPITAKLVADLITTAGADRVLTTDLHAGQIMGFFNIPVDNLNALPVLIPYIRTKYSSEDLVIVSPDAGGVERARKYASHLGNADLAVIDKRRGSNNQVSEMKVIGDVKGKVCLIVDDMVDTGGTLVKACATLFEEGATAVSACCVHPVLSGNAFAKIGESQFGELIVTDTIPHIHVQDEGKVKVISMAKFFANAIKRIHDEDSVSGLLKAV